MANENSFYVTKHRRWFWVMGPNSSVDPEIESYDHTELAHMMLNHIEIMRAYQDDFLTFDSSISNVQEEEIQEILNNGTLQEQFEFFHDDDGE